MPFEKLTHYKINSKIDVVIPVYNGQDFIIQAIKSIENQTYQPNKILIVDDGSTDDTAKLILSHQSSIPIQCIQKENGGLSSARNKGILSSTSQYIAFLDADDVWYPNKLQEQIKIFETPIIKILALFTVNMTLLTKQDILQIIIISFKQILILKDQYLKRLFH